MSDETKTGGDKGDTKGKAEEAKVDEPLKVGDRVGVAVVVAGPHVKRLDGKVTKITKGKDGVQRLSIEIATPAGGTTTLLDVPEAPSEGPSVNNMAALPCYLRLPPPK